MPLSELVAASPEQVGVDSKLLHRVFQRARQEVDSGAVDALQVAVCRAGKLAGMATFGTCPGGQKATDSTLFSIFSCTKLTVAIAMWQLLDSGKLKLTDKVADILPSFGTHGKEDVTVLHLLTFTCGFPNPPTDISSPETFGTSEQRRAAFAEWELEFPPGSSWAYHGGSAHWVMVEILSELNGGRDFRELLRENVLDPIGLNSFLVGTSDVSVQDKYHFCDISVRTDADRYGGQDPNPGFLKWNRAESRALGVPGGGGWTTAADLALLLQPLLHGGKTHSGGSLVSAEMIEVATTQHTDERHTRLLTENPTIGLQVRRGLVVELAGEDEISVPAEGMDQATFYTDKVELSSMAGQTIPAMCLRQAGFGLNNSAGAFGHDGVRPTLSLVDPQLPHQLFSLPSITGALVGGKFVWADPATGISFALVTNTFTQRGACLIRSMELSTLANAALLDQKQPNL